MFGITHIQGGTIRKVWATEHDKFRDHLLRLDAENRHLRFGMAVTDAFLEDYAAHVHDHHSVVYGFFVDGELHAAAELRMLDHPSLILAEGAFSVERGFQNRGLGTELVGRVVRAARNRGVDRLYMNCLSENTRMQKIARKYHARLEFDHGEVTGELLPSGPTYLTFMAEAVEDRFGFVMAVFDLQTRFMRAA